MAVLRKILTDLYYNNRFGRLLISPIFKLRNSVIPLETLLRKRFKRMLGYTPDLKNPKTLNEKIQWLKINDRSQLHVKCADKYSVREHVARKIGEQHLIPLVLVTENVEELNPESLPDYPVIIKSNHDSGGVTIVTDKSSIAWDELKKRLKKLLANSYGNNKGEWQYEKIRPRIIVEKLLLDEEGKIPSDYKLHCMNGAVKFIQVDLDRSTDHRRNMYDREWQKLPFSWKYANGKSVNRPVALEEMIGLAEKFAEDFHYVRVDLYNIKEKIYFGELTFHSESGFGKFQPETWDLKLGEMLKLPIKDE